VTGKLVPLIRELGPLTALLYLAGRAFARLGEQASLHDLLLYVQPVREAPLLPPGRGSSIAIRTFDGAAAVDAGLPLPPGTTERRRRSGIHCLAAYQAGVLIGYHWINLGPHDDEMVRCRYRAPAWSFHLFIEPAHRGGLAYARLCDASWALLRAHRRRAVASYVVASSRPAVQAEERVGGRRVGRAVHLRLGRLQLMLASLPPFLHLSWSDAGAPELRLDRGDIAWNPSPPR
jgi:hypothetical protein